MITTSRNCRLFWIYLLTASLLAQPIAAAGQAAGRAEAKAVDSQAIAQAVSRGVAYLQQAQTDDGSFSAASGPGITAIVASALLRSERTVNDPLVARSLGYLERHRQADGGIYQEGSRYRNYETSLAIVCFQLANQDGRYNELLAGAEKFVKGHQWDEEEGHNISSMYYGGSGYGSHERPDLSNTSFFVDALHSLGRGEDDPAIQKALVFISRSQNLESEHNTSEFAAKVNDGGFFYTPAAGGQSMAGQTPEGGLRSYGSMTYAGLKSMIYAGLSRDDPRVKAASEWIRRHYTVEENPGMGDAGLYYYYHTFAKALDVLGDEQLVDERGQAHDWRADLASRLIAEQQADGRSLWGG